jgi:peptide/nickel transport system permease protein
LRRYPYTFLLATQALIVSVALGVPLALIAASTSNRLLDQAIQVSSLVGAAMPAFWLGIVLQWAFYGKFALLPGLLDKTSAGAFLASLILPVITLSGITLGIVARMTFSMAREVLESDYIRTARAKGLPESTILARHCLKNLAPTLLTIIGLRFGTMLAGSVYVESIFGIPGIGSFAVTAILNNDYPAVIGVGMSIGFVFTLVNMIVDFLYPLVDPQISES